MAMNIKPNEMVNTALFRSIAPFIKSISNSRLVYELCVASNHHDVFADKERLSMAFPWAETPQGWEFWAALSGESQRGKAND